MTVEELAIWRSLRSRVVQGDALTSEEQAIYDAGVRELDAEEERMFALSAKAQEEEIRLKREEIRRLAQESQALRTRCEEMDRRIIALEKTLDESAAQTLSAGN